MNSKTGNVVSSTAKATVVASRPENGAAITVQSIPGAQVDLEFDPAFATASRDGNSLVFDIDGSGKLVLEDFFAVGDESLPSLRLPDGTVVASEDFFAGSDLDLSTAAGPGNSSASSGGGDYADDAGALAGGVDKSGALGGMGQWSAGSLREEDSAGADSLVAASVGAAGPGAAPGTSPGTTPGTTPGKTPEITPEAPPSDDIRAVLYMHSALADGFQGARHVSTGLFFRAEGGDKVRLGPDDIAFIDGQSTGNAGQYSVKISAPEGWSESCFNLAYDLTSGLMTFTLTADGFAKLQSMADGNLLDYFTVSVTNTATGEIFDYRTQVVATTGQEFDSWAQNQADAESAMGALNIGAEYHSAEGGKGPSGPYKIISSDGNDEIIINDRFAGGSEIWASATSGDKLTGADDVNHIELRQGMSAAQGDVNIIDSSGGDLVLDNGISATGKNAENRITLGGDLEVNSGSAAVNHLYDDTRDVFRALGENAKNSVTLGGDLNVNVNGPTRVIFTNGDGQNSIKADGKLDVNISEGDVKGASNIILANKGNVDASFKGIDVDMTSTHLTKDLSAGTLSSFINATGKYTNDDFGQAKVNVKSEGDVNIAQEATVAGNGFQLLKVMDGGEINLEVQGDLIVSAAKNSTTTSLLTVNQSNTNAPFSNPDTKINVDVSGDIKATLNGNRGHAMSSNLNKYNNDTPEDLKGNTITAGGDVEIEITSYLGELKGQTQKPSTLDGMYSSGGKNLIDAENGTVSISLRNETGEFYTYGGPGSLMQAKTVQKDQVKAMNEIKAQNVVLENYRPGEGIVGRYEDTEPENYLASGLAAAGSSYNVAQNLVTAEQSVSLSVEANRAMAMYAGRAGSNIITAGEEVLVNVVHNDAGGVSYPGIAYGMLAKTDGQNLIQASEDSTGITITLEVEKGEGAIAMYAYDKGAVNKIAGSDHADVISVTGKIVSQYDGKNIIEAGAGNDIIRLEGAVGKGSLTLSGGDDHDTLILHADNAEAFNTFYKDWLADPKLDMQAMSVEAIQLNLGTMSGTLNWTNSGNDALGWLQSLAEKHDIQLEYNLGGVGSVNLSAIVDGLGPISCIDLSGGEGGDAFTLDNLLPGNGEELYIRGDANDTVNLGSNWTETGMSNGYNSYTDSNGNVVYIEQMLKLVTE